MVRLQYDDAAFYIFAIAVIGVYTFPATYFAVGKILRSTVLAKPVTGRRLLKGEEEKSRRLRAEMASKIWTPCFIAQLVVLAFLWVLLFTFLSSYTAGGDIKQFDPFEILEIDVEATSSEIRRAYRKLSLQYHPDKNKDDPEAASKFMMIAKAHEALTDEEAKKNYELYGSPDGKQQMQVSIGLPSIFMNKGNHTPILIVYLVILVVMIPVGVGTYYASTNKLGENGIMKATYDRILALFKPEDAWNSKLVPEILGAAEEFADLKYTSEDARQLEKLHKKWERAAESGRRVIEKLKKFNSAEADKAMSMGHAGEAQKIKRCFYNNMALTAYMMRAELTPRNTENARVILATSPRIVEALIKSAFLSGMQRPTSNSWTVVTELIHFQQRLYQSLWVNGDRNWLMYLQLPHFTQDLAYHAAPRGRKALMDIGDGFRDNGRLQGFLRQRPGDRKGLKDLTDDQRDDVNHVAAILPNWDVDVQVFVDGENIIFESSVVTMKVVVTRNEIPENSTATEIFAPRFPDGKFESLWVMMSAPVPETKKKRIIGTRLMSIKKIASRERVVEGVLQFQAPPKVGKYAFTVAVKSDCYFGCDFQIEHIFDVKPKDSPELVVFERHEEDEELIREAHGQIVGVGDDESDSSDDDSDDDDAPTVGGGGSKGDGEDEDDDSDSESSDSESSSSDSEEE